MEGKSLLTAARACMAAAIRADSVDVSAMLIRTSLVPWSLAFLMALTTLSWVSASSESSNLAINSFSTSFTICNNQPNTENSRVENISILYLYFNSDLTISGYFLTNMIIHVYTTCTSMSGETITNTLPNTCYHDHSKCYKYYMIVWSRSIPVTKDKVS